MPISSGWSCFWFLAPSLLLLVELQTVMLAAWTTVTFLLVASMMDTIHFYCCSYSMLGGSSDVFSIRLHNNFQHILGKMFFRIPWIKWVSWTQTWRSSFISEMWWVSYKGFGVWLPPTFPIFPRKIQGEVPRCSAFRNASWSSICMSG